MTTPLSHPTPPFVPTAPLGKQAVSSMFVRAVNAGKKPVRKKGRNKTGTRLRKVRVHGHGTMGAGAS